LRNQEEEQQNILEQQRFWLKIGLLPSPAQFPFYPPAPTTHYMLSHYGLKAFRLVQRMRPRAWHRTTPIISPSSCSPATISLVVTFHPP
jgi:hypothetical protein